MHGHSAPGNPGPSRRFATKQGLTLFALVALMLWPALHYALYRNFGIDPWRLCGWAMYARPRSAQHLTLFALHGTSETQVTSLPPGLRQQTEAAIARRVALGSLATFDSLAPALLAGLPDADGVRLVLRRTAFDCRSGKLDQVDEDTRSYWRRDAGVPGSPAPASP